MITKKFDSLPSIILEEVQKVFSYFSGLNKDDVTSEILASRIKHELPVRLNNLSIDVSKMAISYLDSDARESIGEWQTKNKNAFYDAAISEKIIAEISVLDFSLGCYAKPRYVAFVAIGATSVAVTYITAINPLVLIPIAGISYFAVPKYTASYEKENIMNQLSDYLKMVEAEFNRQIITVATSYIDQFNTLSKELGEQ